MGNTECGGLNNMNTKEIGKMAEDFACDFLKKQNIEIVERNWSCALGEIDIIAKDGEELVFAEVRCRKKTSAIRPMDTVSFSKQKRILNAIEQYVADNCLNMYYRFDFVGVAYSLVCGVPVFEIENYYKRADLC